jgi:predicted  nucleic acid-binding Zn-ribbon protein
MRLEHDLRLRTDELNNQIMAFKHDVEMIQEGLLDKNLENMKLFNEKSSMDKILENKDNEINTLKINIKKLESELEMFREQKYTIEKNYKIIYNEKEYEKMNSEKFIYEIERIKKILSEQDMLIRSLNEEKMFVCRKNDELNYELKNFMNKYQNRDDNFSLLQKQLEEAKNRINSLEVKTFNVEL